MTPARVVAFRAAGVACAADPADVERILRAGELLPAPGAPPWIAGIVSGPRGLLAVVDVGRRLFPDRETPPPRDLLAGTFDGVSMAVGADEVEGILPVETSDVPPPEGLASSVSTYLKGVVEAGGEKRLLIDVRRLATDEAPAAAAARQIGIESTERRDQSS